MTRSRLAQALLAACSCAVPAFAGSILFEGGTIISFNNATQSLEVLRDASLLTTNDTIAAIFDSSSNITVPAGTEMISAQGKIISPGFVDTHRHGWQTAYKTLGSNTTLAEYFERYGEFTQAGTVFGPDDVYYGQLVGIYEALNSGVTTILEHAHATFSNATVAAYLDASIDSGVRMWFCYALHTLTNGFSIEEQMANYEDLVKDERLPASLVKMGLAYDTFASASDEEIQSVLDLAKSSNAAALTTHYLGGPWFDANSPTRLNDFSFLNTSMPIVFSHASYITPDDAVLLRKYNHYISTTPESEMHYGHGHEYSALIQDQAALGVDTHFTYSTDIITQARIWLQSTRLKLFAQTMKDWAIPRNNPMSVNQAFLLATRSGGLALHRPDIGVLQVGAKADVVVFDGDSPNMLGWVDPVAAIILHSHVGDIKHVLVDGKWRKREGQLVLAQNRTAVEQKFLQSARRIQKIWEQTPLPDLQGEYSNGVEYGSAVTVDVQRGNGTGY
ncbi:amidohydrolase family protein [Phyllosticta citribraziliensis]|uniref:Amidohydrolase family protein n=1 Tax=Phyllosticta citribraziliensis TaxID=989973 RepID=A0ABR1LTY2_9PEZI